MMRGGTSLRREVVLGFSFILLVALTLFAAATYAILQRSLASTGTQSLRQTAAAAERLMVPPGIPRLQVSEESLPPTDEAVEVLRRRTRLATGDEVDIIVARTGDVEQRALRSFAFTALALIPLTAILAALAGRSLADRILQPLSRLVTASREIGIGALSRRVEEPAHPVELRELAQAYNGMLERLQRAVEALRSFTADASHELRTPLAAIRGYSELTRRGGHELPDDVRHALSRIESESVRMSGLVDDLLLLARLDEGRQLAREAVDLGRLVVDITADARAASPDHDWVVRVPESPVVVLGDQPRLHQAIANLLANARVHTPAGTQVTAALGVLDGFAIVTVTDTGPGIPPEVQPVLFERFARADTSRSRATGSTGLGLAITAAIVRAHDGVVDAVSEPGQTVFRVRLPLAPDA